MNVHQEIFREVYKEDLKKEICDFIDSHCDEWVADVDVYVQITDKDDDEIF